MNLLYILAGATDKWPTGAVVLVSLFGLLILTGLAAFLAWRAIVEIKKVREEKEAYIEGVLSKGELHALVDTTISKSSNEMPFYIVSVDIDKYSQVVNAFGEKHAKNIVLSISQRISKLLPFQVQMGRTETDNFVILFKTDYTYEEVYHVVEQIFDVFSQPIHISYDVEAQVTASIALAQFPRHGRSFKQLFESLQVALYSAKRQGGNKIVIYSEELNKDTQDIQYYEQVKNAIEKKEFILYYQPIVDSSKKEVCAAEALLRWEHPVLGLINPRDFINILEQSGDIYWIGIWGLEAMIEEYNLIKTKHIHNDFQVSINLSMKQLMNTNLAIDFQKILKKYKMAAKDLIIELDEFIMYDHQSQIKNNIIKLRELGFKIAVDGFSFDNNTLMRLDKLPIDIIKFDASFIDDENRELMHRYCEIIASYAAKHNIEVIVEKVETLDEIKYFESLNIVKCQGYYLSKPVSPEDLERFVGNKAYIASLLEGAAEVVVTDDFTGGKVEEEPVVEEENTEETPEVEAEKEEN